MIFLPPAIGIFLFLVGSGLLVSYLDLARSVGLGTVYIAMGLISPLFAVDALIIFFTTECVLTNRRVVGKIGFVGRKSLEILLAKVEGLQVDQGILGRFCNYGTVTVSGTGGSHTPFQGIAKPLEFRKSVQQQIAVVQN